MFARQITKDVAVGDEIVTVRKLSGKSLQKAREVKRAETVANMRDIGSDLIKSFREEREKMASAVRVEALPAPTVAPTVEELEKARKETFSEYDRDTVLVAGIAKWTPKIPVNPENIADLDEESATLLHNEILDLSVAPINTEEVSKNV